jgi:hypothetical protein
MWSVPRLYNGSLFVALSSTESRTTETRTDRIGELSRVLESRQSKVIEDEMIRRLHSDLK